MGIHGYPPQFMVYQGISLENEKSSPKILCGFYGKSSTMVKSIMANLPTKKELWMWLFQNAFCHVQVPEVPGVPGHCSARASKSWRYSWWACAQLIAEGFSLHFLAFTRFLTAKSMDIHKDFMGISENQFFGELKTIENSPKWRWNPHFINGNFRILKWRYCTI